MNRGKPDTALTVARATSRLCLIQPPVAARALPTGGRRTRTSSARIARENAAAATLSHQDARLILAIRTAEALEGGAAGILRPERRRRLMDLATRLGLRPFDASLVIAVAQDGARYGTPIQEMAGRLRLVRPPNPRRGSVRRALLHAGLVVAGAGGAVAVAIQWLLG